MPRHPCKGFVTRLRTCQINQPQKIAGDLRGACRNFPCAFRKGRFAFVGCKFVSNECRSVSVVGRENGREGDRVAAEAHFRASKTNFLSVGATSRSRNAHRQTIAVRRPMRCANRAASRGNLLSRGAPFAAGVGSPACRSATFRHEPGIAPVKCRRQSRREQLLPVKCFTAHAWRPAVCRIRRCVNCAKP
jgi:hypothetical protein